MPPPRNRKTHIIRIFGTNRAGDILDDVWADVERVDELGSKQSDDNSQVEKRRFRWMDDPEGDNYNPNGNPARKVTTLKLCDPEVDGQDFSDPEEWVPIDVIDEMQTRSSALNSQARKERYRDDADNENGRTVEKRRISHYDTNIDDDAEAAADDGRKVYVVRGADGSGAVNPDYRKDVDTKDEDQYIEYEVLTRFNTRLNNEKKRERSQEAMGTQNSKTKLLNQHLIDDSDPAKLDHAGPEGINPPYRLDPWQNIINVSWGGLAVEFEGNIDELSGSVGSKADMRKGLISVWFRIPQTSVDSAVRRRASSSLNGVIPILTFGGQLAYPDVIVESYKIGEYYSFGAGETIVHDVLGTKLRTLGTLRTLPSLIGVKCDEDGTARIFFNLQFPNKASVTNGLGLASGWIPELSEFDGVTPVGIIDFTYSDGSDIYTLESARFGDVGAIVTPDHWHHLLLSWDATAATSSIGKETEEQEVATLWDFITGHNLVYCALDDVNLEGPDLPIDDLDVDPPNENATVPDVISENAAGASHRNIGQNNASFTAGRIPLTPLIIPAKLDLGTETIEMGPLQIFSGMARDTDSGALRRLFIDENGKPQPPSVAEEVLGKPDVLFHKRGSWSNGHNQGIGKEDLLVTGKIERWDPEPSLFGPQIPT